MALVVPDGRRRTCETLRGDGLQLQMFEGTDIPDIATRSDPLDCSRWKVRLDQSRDGTKDMTAGDGNRFENGSCVARLRFDLHATARRPAGSKLGRDLWIFRRRLRIEVRGSCCMGSKETRGQDEADGAEVRSTHHALPRL